MRFISALVAGALAVVASAQSGNQANPFTNTDFSGIAVGEPITITWNPTTTGTVTLLLVQGDPDSLDTVETIKSSITNSGSYTWTPDSSIVKGSDYALKIVDDSDSENYNYTIQFSIDSDVTASSAPTTAASSTEAPTSTEEPTTSSTEEPSTTTEETTATEATTTDASSTEASTTDASSTDAATTTGTSAPTTTSGAAGTSSSQGAAATGGAKVGAGLVGFVGAAMLLL